MSEVDKLRSQLTEKDVKLLEALKKVESANARKQTVEKAIYRQLSKTHQVLKQAKGNLEQQRDGMGASASMGNLHTRNRH